MKDTKVIKIAGETVAKVALSVGKSTTNAACYGWFHQPKEPKAMTKYKKNI